MEDHKATMLQSGLGATEDRMGADAAPDDVWLARLDFIAILEGSPAVIGPSHLPNAGMALYALHSKPGMKALLVLGEIGVNWATAARNSRCCFGLS
jgi:hypothetical protein